MLHADTDVAPRVPAPGWMRASRSVATEGCRTPDRADDLPAPERRLDTRW